MSLILRARIIAIGAIAIAFGLACEIAAGDYVLPFMIGSAALILAVVAFFRVPVDGMVLGALLFGYFVGNRGFAQLTLLPTVPLLPAEVGLMVAGGWIVLQSAWCRTLPFRPNLLNWCVLLWLVVGTIRVLFDVRSFGILALRDYAMIYYAAFFFIAQGTDANSQRFLRRVLLLASIVQPIAALLVAAFPEFFLLKLAVRGVPLIYFKGDLAFTFTAVSALLLYFLVEDRHRYWAWSLATIELLLVITGANRASMLGAVAALAWLAMSRARRFVWVQAGAIMAALLCVAGLALITENEWAQRKLDGAAERVSSVTDIAGRGVYVTEESGMKGDNNRFRAVWWKTVVDNTLAENPFFGVGFGADLTRNFIQQYNVEMAEEVTGRSPHSIVVSTIGRIGFVGLAILLLLLGLMVAKTYRIVRDPMVEGKTLALWASVWVIFVSACFGVVLEGPMGAVVFWTLLGLANAQSVATEAAPDEATTVSPVSELALPAADASVRETAAT
jgi:hypothetical protein